MFICIFSENVWFVQLIKGKQKHCGGDSAEKQAEGSSSAVRGDLLSPPAARPGPLGRRAEAVGSRITAWESMALLHPAVYAPPNEQVSGVFRPSVVVLTLSLPLSGSHQLPVDINCKQT